MDERTCDSHHANAATATSLMMLLLLFVLRVAALMNKPRLYMLLWVRKSPLLDMNYPRLLAVNKRLLTVALLLVLRRIAATWRNSLLRLSVSLRLLHVPLLRHVSLRLLLSLQRHIRSWSRHDAWLIHLTVYLRLLLRHISLRLLLRGIYSCCRNYRLGLAIACRLPGLIRINSVAVLVDVKGSRR
jgi:hypothetical protein